MANPLYMEPTRAAEDDAPLDEQRDGEPNKAAAPMNNSRAHIMRALALLCACSLSIGSHYASYILGPLKSRLNRELGTSNTEFSLLIAAFSLNSTWTPLVGGLLANRLGTTATSIIATGLIFLGQAILLAGDSWESVRLMAFGMFVFGLGVSPLSVVQESIVVRFFKNHGLGLSMAFGLVVGKASSFAAARTSYPLSEHFGSRAPFYAATFLAGLSVAMNLVYLSVSRLLVKGTGTELEASELNAEARHVAVESVSEAQALKQVAEKRRVELRDITKLGDVFWAYIGLNVLCGMIWTPFTHLAPNIIQLRYDISETEASNLASYLLAGSVVLYPIVGFVTDRLKRGPILVVLLVLSSCLTMLCYLWLVLPPDFTRTPVPSVIAYCVGQGFAPLLLVILVPTIVPAKYVPTTLGAHKSLEQTGSTIFQTFAGLLLDKPKVLKDGPKDAPEPEEQRHAIQHLLNLFLFLNVLHLLAILGLWALSRRRKELAIKRPIALTPDEDMDEDEDMLDAPPSPIISRSHHSSFRKARRQESHSLSHRPSSGFESFGSVRSTRESIAEALADDARSEEQPLLPSSNIEAGAASSRVVIPAPEDAATQAGLARSGSEVRRGEAIAIICVMSIVFAWILFIWTAFLRLRSKEDRQGE